MRVPILMDLVRQIKGGSKGLLIADLSGLGKGKVKVKKTKLIESIEITWSHSKPIEVNQKVQKM